MSDREQRSLVPKRDDGVFHKLSLRVRLIIRLMADRRVNWLLKLLPIGALAYLVVPDLAPGPIDDALIIWLGTTVFVDLCPPEIVQEHMDELTSVVEGEWREIEGGE